MNTVAIAIHGGAGPDEEFLRNNHERYKDSLRKALQQGYAVLAKGGSSVEAVETAVRFMEDDPLFNAGRGAALNSKGEVEMDAAIMDGKNLKAGAGALLSNICNPVSFARVVMEKTHHVLIAGPAADEFAKKYNILCAPSAYFITEHQVDEYLKKCKTVKEKELLNKAKHGTVGAVALDQKGNLAAATSTGGTVNCLAGRIGDSAMIGSGCYADNRTCAVSGTGDGEALITRVLCYSVASTLEHTKRTLQETCDYVIHEKNKDVGCDLGIISVSASGEIGISFNSETMLRAWTTGGNDWHVEIY
jgi:beta-aspartyl-peptidase (threonine type)